MALQEKIVNIATTVFANLVVWSVFSLIFLTALVFQPYKYIVCVIAKIVRADLRRVDQGLNAILLADDFEKPLSTTVTYMILESDLDIKKLRQFFDKRVFTILNKNGTLHYQRLKEYVVNYLGYTFYKEDDNFTIENHVREYDYDSQSLYLPNPCREKDLERITGSAIGLNYVEKRSPWEFLLIPNYIQNPEDLANKTKKVVVMSRFHHGLGDGYSNIRMLEELFQVKFPIPQPNFPKFPLWKQIAATVITPFKMIYDFTNIIYFETCSDYPRTWSTGGEPSNEYHTCFVEAIPVDAIKGIKNELKVGYMSVLVGAIMYATGRFMSENSNLAPSKLSLCFSYPKPNHPGGITNHANSVVFSFDLKAASPADSITKAHRKLISNTTTMAPLCTDFLLQVLSNWPNALRLPAYRSRYLASVICGNLPVSTDAVFSKGMTWTGAFTSVGPCNYYSGVSIVLGGSNGQQRITITADKKIFPSKEKLSILGSYVHKAIQDLTNLSIDEKLKQA